MHKIYDKTSSNIYQNHKDLIDGFMEYSFKRLNYSKPVTIYFDDNTETEEGYAQKDPHLRKMEEEAYLNGNLNLRDFEDKRKSKAIYNSISIKVGE